MPQSRSTTRDTLDKRLAITMCDSSWLWRRARAGFWRIGLLMMLLVAGTLPAAEAASLAFENRGNIKGLHGSYISIVHRGAEYQFFGNCIGEETPGLTMAVGTSPTEVGPAEVIASNALIDDLLTPAGEPEPTRMLTRPVVRFSEKEQRYYAIVHVARGYPPKDGRVYPAMLASKTDDPRKGWQYLGQFKGEPATLFGPSKGSWTSGMAFLLNDTAAKTIDHEHPLANRFVLYNEFGDGLKLLYSLDGSEWFFFRDQHRKLVDIQPEAYRNDGGWIFASAVSAPAGYFMFVSYRWTNQGPAGHRLLYSKDGLEWRQLREFAQGPKNFSLAYDAAKDLLYIMPTVLGNLPYGKELHTLKPANP